MSSFRDFRLSDNSIRVLDAMDITEPTSIQERAIPFLMEGRDLIGQAYTGSGKTLAFALPIIERLDRQHGFVQALILTPTRELARQVASVFDDMTRGSQLRVACIYGGAAFSTQEQALRSGAQIVVGTPGRVLDMAKRRSLKLDRVTFVILDEADEMLDKGFGPDVERILSMTPRARQTAMFSATMPDWVEKLSARYLIEPEIITTEEEDRDEPDIDHVVIEAYTEDRFNVLVKLLQEPSEGTTVVFGRTKHGVRKVGQRLQKLGYNVSVLEGNLSQGARERALDRFRSGRAPILVATNVAARGLDILHIGRVVNYEMPDTAELFSHRAGRTGRMGRSGRTFTILGAVDLPKWQMIERRLGHRVPRVTPSGEPVQVAPAAAVGRSRSSSKWGRRRFSRRATA